MFFHQSFLFLWGFLSCFSLSNSFFLSLFFPYFKLCFLFNIKKNICKKSAQKNSVLGVENCSGSNFRFSWVAGRRAKNGGFDLTQGKNTKSQGSRHSLQTGSGTGRYLPSGPQDHLVGLPKKFSGASALADLASHLSSGGCT